MWCSSAEPDSTCSEWDRLFGEFAAAIAEIMALQVEPVHAMRSQDLELIPTDILLQLAEDKKRRTKDALLSYIAQDDRHSGTAAMRSNSRDPAAVWPNSR